MSETMYLLDNHVLGFIGPERRASGFFAKNCRIPEDVAHEARFFAYSKSLAAITLPVTPIILEHLVEVMETVPAAPNRFIDLHRNNGTADPVLIATALALNHPSEPGLFDASWVIVTNDKAVLAKAKEFCIETKTPEQFVGLMDAAGPVSAANGVD